MWIRNVRLAYLVLNTQKSPERLIFYTLTKFRNKYSKHCLQLHHSIFLKFSLFFFRLAIMTQLPPSVAKSLEETKAEYRLLGRSGLRVSVPIVGCMSIGNPDWADWVIGPERALPLLKAAYDAGLNTASNKPSSVLGLSKLLTDETTSGIRPISIPMGNRNGSLPRQSSITIYQDTNL